MEDIKVPETAGMMSGSFIDLLEGDREISRIHREGIASMLRMLEAVVARQEATTNTYMRLTARLAEK